MSKQNGQKSDEAKSGDQGFLSRWSARKTQIARAAVPEDNLLEQSEVIGLKLNNKMMKTQPLVTTSCLKNMNCQIQMM